MGIGHRKRLQTETPRIPPLGRALPPQQPPIYPKPLLSPGRERSIQQKQKHLIRTGFTITALLIGVALLVGIIRSILNRHYSRRNSSRRRNAPILFHPQEDLLDEDRGPAIDHPIWFIHTVGLQQSVIDSITVCKYRKDEGLIDGTECSVCLSEFEEDESLRLLPKCSHAFHLTCIDTWLRSHKNCPLCRAPIVSEATGSQVSVDEPNMSVTVPSQETQVENLQNHTGVESNQVGDGGTSEVGADDEIHIALAIEDGRRAETSKNSTHDSSSTNCHSRVLSNLADNQRVEKEEIQPMRRSVSMDSSSASMIYHAVANIVTDQGSSKTQPGQLKRSSKEIVAKPDSGTTNRSKMTKSSSIGRSLQKGPVSMRSFSSSRSFFPSRQSKSAPSSILPS